MATILRTVPALALILTVSLAWGSPGMAASLDCLVSRGNLCFPTGCNNSGKTQRISLDLESGTLRLCPNRFDDAGCSDVPVKLDIRDTALVGITEAGPEMSARAIFLNRVTGAMTTTLLSAGGVAAVDFGTCEIPR